MTRWKFFLSLIGLGASAQQPPRKPVSSNVYKNGVCPICFVAFAALPTPTLTLTGRHVVECQNCHGMFCIRTTGPTQ